MVLPECLAHGRLIEVKDDRDQDREAKVVGMAFQARAELVDQSQPGEQGRRDEADGKQPDERDRGCDADDRHAPDQDRGDAALAAERRDDARAARLPNSGGVQQQEAEQKRLEDCRDPHPERHATNAGLHQPMLRHVQRVKPARRSGSDATEVPTRVAPRRSRRGPLGRPLMTAGPPAARRVVAAGGVAHVCLWSRTRSAMGTTLGPPVALAAPHADGLGTDAPVRLEPGDDLDRDGMAEEPLDVTEQLTLIHADERDGDAVHACATGAADAMDVVGGDHRQLVVDHVRQRIDVEAAGGDLGRDEQRDTPGLEVGQGADPLGLALVAMDDRDVDAVPVELLGEPVGAVLGAGEDERLVDLSGEHEVAQELALALAVDRVDDLLDEVRGSVPFGDLDLRRAIEEPVRQASDLVREGRREHEVLSVSGQSGQDPADVADEAHVEHAVRLVQDEDLDPVQVDGALAEVVEQPARGGHHDLGAGAQRARLGMEADAAEDGGRADGPMTAVGTDAGLDLHGQLPGGNEHEDADATTALCARRVVEALKDGQHEGGRLAGPRLGAGQQVTSGKDDRNRLALYGGRLGVAGIRNCAEQVGRQPELSKGQGVGSPDEALPRDAGPGQGVGDSGFSGKGPGRRPKRPWKPGGGTTLAHATRAPVGSGPGRDRGGGAVSVCGYLVGALAVHLRDGRGPRPEPVHEAVVHRERRCDQDRELDVGIGRAGGLRRRDVIGREFERVAANGPGNVEEGLHLRVVPLRRPDLYDLEKRHTGRIAAALHQGCRERRMGVHAEEAVVSRRYGRGQRLALGAGYGGPRVVVDQHLIGQPAEVDAQPRGQSHGDPDAGDLRQPTDDGLLGRPCQPLVVSCHVRLSSFRGLGRAQYAGPGQFLRRPSPWR